MFLGLVKPAGFTAPTGSIHIPFRSSASLRSSPTPNLHEGDTKASRRDLLAQFDYREVSQNEGYL